MIQRHLSQVARTGIVIGAVLGVVGGVAHLVLIARREDRRPPG